MNTKRILLVCLIAGVIAIPATIVRAQADGSGSNWKQWLLSFGVQTPAAPAGAPVLGAELMAELPTKQEAAGGGILDILERQKKAIAGSWLVTTTLEGPGAPPPFKELQTYGADGTLIVSTQGEAACCPHATAGHGAWAHRGGRTFAHTYIALWYNPDASLFGTLKVRSNVTLNEAGDQTVGIGGIGELVDPNGNVLFSLAGTIKGVRIKVEPLP